jgi:hypothetical protein
MNAAKDDQTQRKRDPPIKREHEMSNTAIAPFLPTLTLESAEVARSSDGLTCNSASMRIARHPN